MATLYVTEPGARIEKHYRSILVSVDDEVLMRVPLGLVSEIVIVGRASMTTPAMLAILDAGAGVSLVTRSGALRGRLVPPTPKNLPLRRLQYQRAADPEFALSLSRRFVYGKLRNQCTMARRICRRRPHIDPAPIDRIRGSLKQLDDVRDLGKLRGLEGAAASAYFKIFRESLREGWHFPKRARRPPPDPINALLSLGYTLLNQNLMAAAEIVGLDPYEGFFHADKYGRPALALDLVEEFRCLIVDAEIRNVINRRIIKQDDFMPGKKGGVILKPKPFRKFLRRYSKKIQARVYHPYAGRRLTYQKCFEVQVVILRKVIEGDLPEYQPFITK